VTAERRTTRSRWTPPLGVGDVRAVVLVLAGYFDGICDFWLHGLVLWSAAYAVGWHAAQERIGLAAPAQPLLLQPATRRRSRPTGVVRGVSVLLFAVTVGSWHRYTWPMTGAIVLVAVTDSRCGGALR